MKRIFRRNQIIITTLAVMIAAAGYLNYSAKREAAGTDVYEAGMMEISDEDILAENQASSLDDDGSLAEIASLDGDGEELLPDGNVAAGASVAGSGNGSAAVSGSGTSEGAGAEQAAGSQDAEAAGSQDAEAAGSDMAGETGIADAGTAGEAGVLDASGTDSAEAGMENPGEAVLTNGTSVSEYIAGVQLNREQIRAKNKETLMQLINSDQISEAEKQAAVQNMIELTEISEKENAAETLLKAKGFVDPVVSITDGQVDVVVNAVSITDQERAQIEDIVKRKTEVGADGIVITLMDLAE